MMGKQQNLHINLHSSHLTKRNSLYVRYLQIDTADLKSADRKVVGVQVPLRAPDISITYPRHHGPMVVGVQGS